MNRKPPGPSEASFQERYKELFKYSLYLTNGNRDDAKDLLHSSLLDKCIKRNIDILSAEVSLPYLKRIIKNAYIDLLRKQKNKEKHLSYISELPLDIDETILYLESLERFVEQGFVSLTKSELKIFPYMISGWKNSDIAKILSSTKGSVKVLKSRIRDKLIDAALANPEELEVIKNKVLHEHYKSD